MFLSLEKRLKLFLKDGGKITIEVRDGKVIFLDGNGREIKREDLKKIFIFI